jgi:hypothetical protein
MKTLLNGAVAGNRKRTTQLYRCHFNGKACTFQLHAAYHHFTPQSSQRHVARSSAALYCLQFATFLKIYIFHCAGIISVQLASAQQPQRLL